MSSRSANRPHSSSCGRTTAGMNCTAWNSVRANALTKSPRAMPRSAFRDRQRADEPGAVRGVQAQQDEARDADDHSLPAASAPNASAYPLNRSPLPSGSVMSRSSVPLVRSRSIAIDVTRNMTMKGAGRTGRAKRLERFRSRVEHVAQQRQQDGRHHEQERERTSVAPDLREHAAGGRPRRPGAQGDAPAITARKASPRSCSRSPAERLRRRVAQDGAVAHKSRVSHARASSITWLETKRVVPASARAWNVPQSSSPEHGVEPDRRLVEHEQLGGRAARPRATRGSARRRRAWRARRPAERTEIDRLEHLTHARRGRRQRWAAK